MQRDIPNSVWIYELLKKKEFSWVMVGGKYRISKKSFDEWLDQNQ